MSQRLGKIFREGASLFTSPAGIFRIPLRFEISLAPAGRICYNRRVGGTGDPDPPPKTQFWKDPYENSDHNGLVCSGH